MVTCTSLTVTSPSGTVTVNSVEYAVDRVAVASCVQPATTIGKVLAAKVSFTVAGANETFDILVTCRDPLGAVLSWGAHINNSGQGTFAVVIEALNAQGMPIYAYQAGDYMQLTATIQNKTP